MNPLKAISICAILSIVTSCTVNILGNFTIDPKYNGVDPRAAPLVNEYLSLAKIRGLKFDHEVSVGFTDIGESTTVAECHVTPFFREISIDSKHWANMTATSRMSTIFHESSHCHCGRKHDYDGGKPYPEPDKKNIFNFNREGYFEDGCPRSIMAPVLLSDDCMVSRYSYYINEMFQNCEKF